MPTFRDRANAMMKARHSLLGRVHRHHSFGPPLRPRWQVAHVEEKAPGMGLAELHGGLGAGGRDADSYLDSGTGGANGLCIAKTCAGTIE